MRKETVTRLYYSDQEKLKSTRLFVKPTSSKQSYLLSNPHDKSNSDIWSIINVNHITEVKEI